MGWQFVKLERTGVSTHPLAATLLRPNMRLDLGGIAKGYALDEAAQVLNEKNVQQFLGSGGGDLVVGEPPPGESGWRIEVGALDVTRAAVVEVSSGLRSLRDVRVGQNLLAPFCPDLLS